MGIALVKAHDSLRVWGEVLSSDPDMVNQPQGSLEDFQRAEVRRQREPSPDREDWTAEDWAEEQKAFADNAFKEAKYRDAAVYYTRALRHTPKNEKLLSNRSLAYLKASRFQL